MNKFFIFSALALVLTLAVAYKVVAANSAESNVAIKGKSKILIAYYSYSGNTKQVAEAIQKAVGGDLFEIKAEGTYPESYRPMTEQAKKEINDGFRPKLLTKVENMAQYDVVFLGSPNWWGTITPQVSSFLDSYDLSGKTVIPFITHGGGGVQNTVTDMTAQCKGCNVSDAPWVGYGSRTLGVESWAKGFVKD
jgi:flavodoxin